MGAEAADDELPPWDWPTRLHPLAIRPTGSAPTTAALTGLCTAFSPSLAPAPRWRSRVTRPESLWFYRTDRGSSASRREAPNRVNGSTRMKIALPGKTVNIGSDCSQLMLLLIIRPQSGVGSMTPMFRNDSA